jgi:histone demethylase JARID1
MTQRYAPQLPCALEVHPTEEEFAEPMRYIQLLHQRYGKEHGIVKIVPPKDWNPGLGISFDEFTFTTCEQQIDQLNHRCDPNDAHVPFK